MKITDFFNNLFISFANYDSYRSLGNYIDGFKPTARKIICTVDNNNIKEKTKVSSLVNRMSEEMEFLHGPVAAEGVCVGLAQDFAGTNNINFLKPLGTFGTRTIPKAAASRYIFTCKENIFDSIFKKDDTNILIQQEFEGTKIEPKFYLPIIPNILINGSEGIGNGFAQKIFSRNPLTIIDLILNKIQKQKDFTYIPLYFKNFNGKIDRIENNSWEIIGNFERTNQTTITITELPIGYDLEKYINVLNKLEEEKTIIDYSDKSEENKFYFEIKVTREFLKKDDRWILEKLKLIKRVTENFTCIGENNEISEFDNEIQLMDAFYNVRFKYYQKRKDFLIKKLKSELFNLGAKYFFIKLIVDEKITIFKQTKSNIENQLKERKEFDFNKLESFNFLLNLPIHTLTKETYEDLKKQIDSKKEELKEVLEKTIEMMWVNDLEDLRKILKTEF